MRACGGGVVRRAAAARQHNNVHPATAANAARCAPLVGYEAYVQAVVSVLAVLLAASEFARECCDAQFQAFTRHVERTAVLMALPRRDAGATSSIEARFTSDLRATVAVAARNGLDAPSRGVWRTRGRGCSAAGR